MELEENSYIGQDKPSYQAVPINAPKTRPRKYTQESQGRNFKYYGAHPIGMKVRLCFFWKRNGDVIIYQRYDAE
ncbi:hypothetical protein KM043_000608 [Ampulex compressa]|nr:hypothetical protein KM043_000608 [Ampulex compressa]